MQLKYIIGFILTTSLGACGGTSSQDKTPAVNYSNQTINLSQAGRYLSGVFDESAAEIVTYDPSTKQTFVVNANSGKIDVLNTIDISSPTLNTSIDVASNVGINAGSANSVAVYNGLLAVAMDNDTKTDNGWIVFYKTADLSFIKKIEVGALPDMVMFTPDGTQLVAAMEAEPDEGYINDPEGMVSVIDITWNGATLTTNLTNIGFTDFNVAGSRHAELPTELSLAGIGASGKSSVAEDLEPEYVAINESSTKAYIALQENNGIAVINLMNKTVEKIYALGFKDHSLVENAMDIDDKDDAVNIKSYPIKDMYMPDGMTTFEKDGTTYLLTANEGDDRDDWLEGYSNNSNCIAAGYYADDGECKDTLKLKKLSDSDMTLKAGSELEAKKEAMENLKFSYQMTKQMNGGSATDVETIYSYGGRSFSIWDMTDGHLVWDSGKFFETKTAEIYGLDFNNTNSKNKAESRSTKKGPEPEAVVVGTINTKSYAFIALERMGGIMVYEITDPTSPVFIEYLNNRNLQVDPATADAGDLGPEGLKFVSADNSPNGKPMLIVGNEVSGTTTFYQINILLNN